MSMLFGRRETRYWTAVCRVGSILTRPLPYVVSQRLPSGSS